MAISETDRGTIIGKPDHSASIGIRPTVLDLILTIQGWIKEPTPTSLITLVAESPRGTYFEVIDRVKGKELLRKFENLDFLTEFPGEIITHQTPKA